jgi:hypothetical protein
MQIEPEFDGPSSLRALAKQSIKPQGKCGLLRRFASRDDADSHGEERGTAALSNDAGVAAV